ncbi:MAG: twin-arginine translocase TatA/TatE family subunit [Selenomonadaceae bacterium]|nr:twin-arginine translocase TatA/TatE family subunit [Selenomonadaceae bacterium]
MFGIGAGEFIVILIVGLIVFGPGKLPEVGRALGKGLREFRKAQAALSQTLNEVDISEKKSSPVEKPAEDKKSVTADDVINLAKERPIVKENNNEKIFNGIPHDAAAVDAYASIAGSRSSSNGVDKQS